MVQGKRVHRILRGMGRLFIFAMLTLLAYGALCPPAASALSFEVDTTADNPALTDCDDQVAGDCSLRGAISRANDNAGADVITFDADSTNGQPIELSGAAGDNDNDSGDLDIVDMGDLTIQGNGAANTIIDGGGNDRVFHVCPDGDCDNTVTLFGVTIRNGAAGIGGGGGILNNGATLNVQDCTIGGAGFGNWAFLAGGGIYNEAGTTTVDGTTVSANGAGFGTFAGFGGGIDNHDTLTVQNGSVIGGAGAANSADHGGGIYNHDGTTTVDASTVSANTAGTQGGGILNGAELLVRNGSLIGGVGTGNAAGAGGGISNYSKTTIDASTVSGNTATGGGGGINNWGRLTIQSGSTIGGAGAPNQATLIGGGIYNPGGTAIVDGSTVSANTASSGGGIYNMRTLVVRNGGVVGGAGAGNHAIARGGGIHNQRGTATVDGSTISANTSDEDGGGIYNREGTLTVECSTVSYNTAGEHGGGLYNEEGATTVMGSAILDNTANGEGGGVHNDSDLAGATSVTGSRIVGNSDTSFFNNQAAQQTATGNWWGAATGPNTPGADRVGEKVDSSGFLTEPILGCAADLEVSKANDVGGAGRVGTPFTWTLTVANTGVLEVVFYDGDRMVVDDLPAGPTYGPPVAGNFVDITNDAAIDCSIVGDTLTCRAVDEDVVMRAVTGRFDVFLPVTLNTNGTLSNPAGICRADPDGWVTESDEANNDCPADTVEVSNPRVYLPLILR